MRSGSVTPVPAPVLLVPRESTDHEEGKDDKDGTGARRIGGAYTLVEEIGGGATGTVWRALEQSTGEQVAIKLLRDDLAGQPKVVMRFVQERAILRMLRHPHIVEVRELLTVGPSLGLVMDLIPGGSLRRRLRQEGTLAPAEAAVILGQTAAALSHAHRRGVVHRDLKPDNILLSRPGAGDPHVRLTDFGVARVLDAPKLTTTGAVVGTPSYLAPEIIDGGRPTPASDVYALGVVLWELLTGRAPYAGATPYAILHGHLADRPLPRPAQMPEAAWRIVEPCMAKDPAHRPTAAELIERFLTLAEETRDVPPLPAADDPSLADLVPVDRKPQAEGTETDRAETVRKPRHRRRARSRRSRVLTPLAAVTALLVGAGTAGYLLRDDLLGTRTPPASSALTLPSAQVLTSVPATPAPAVHAPRPRPETAAVEPATTPSAVVSAPALPVARTSVVAPVRPAASTVSTPEAARYTWSPLRCDSVMQWLTSRPAVIQTCWATGPGVRLSGRISALPGAAVTVTLHLVEEASGRTVAGPYSCKNLVFDGDRLQRDCGGFDATVPRGRRYAVVQTWTPTSGGGGGVLAPGTARSQFFTLPG